MMNASLPASRYVRTTNTVLTDRFLIPGGSIAEVPGNGLGGSASVLDGRVYIALPRCRVCWTRPWAEAPLSSIAPADLPADIEHKLMRTLGAFELRGSTLLKGLMAERGLHPVSEHDRQTFARGLIASSRYRMAFTLQYPQIGDLKLRRAGVGSPTGAGSLDMVFDPCIACGVAVRATVPMNLLVAVEPRTSARSTEG